ncbi:glycosyltransferase [Nonomuraea sp. NPDC050663]|uniref:glycosyltransferase n=1 Tax=Nonomuraea sp. NPDC050663 TaxID=3364370 RepID=UPI003792E604
MPSPVAFVIPFWSDGSPRHLSQLRETLASVLAQSDEDVVAYVVDDDSACRREVRSWASERIRVVEAPDNRGPGRSRNLGVRAAAHDGCEIVCFLDADDLAHPHRAAVTRRILDDDPGADLVYSGFTVIDEEGRPVPDDQVISGVRIIMDDIARRPLEGRDSWISIAVERDNLTIPSALGVRTSLALAVPFPEDCRFFEDTHTWLRYSGHGADIRFAPQTPSLYRIPSAAAGSESRQRAGGIEAFNRLRVRVTLPGLQEAVRLAAARGVVDEAEGLAVQTRYLLNVAGMLLLEGSTGVAGELVEQARKLSWTDYEKHRHDYPIAEVDR